MRKTSYPNNLLYELLDQYNPETHQFDRQLSHVQIKINQTYLNQVLQSDTYPIQMILEHALNALPERLDLVLTNRYQYHHTLKMCAEQLGLSTERIRQLQQMGLQALKDTGLLNWLVLMIWPIDERDYNAKKFGYEPSLSQNQFEFLIDILPLRTDETMNAYAKRLYESSLKPVFNKLSIDNVDMLYQALSQYRGE